MWNRETWRRGPAIKQRLSSISISQGNSNEVTNIIFTSVILDWKTFEHELVSFLPLLQKFLSLDELLFRLHCTTTNLTHSSDYHGTRNSNYRRNNSNRNLLRNTFHSFYVTAWMKRCLSMPLWLMNRNVFIEKRHSARVSYSQGYHRCRTNIKDGWGKFNCFCLHD